MRVLEADLWPERRMLLTPMKGATDAYMRAWRGVSLAKWPKRFGLDSIFFCFNSYLRTPLRSVTCCPARFSTGGTPSLPPIWRRTRSVVFTTFPTWYVSVMLCLIPLAS